MKTNIVVAIAATIAFTSCQKDFSAEYGTISQTNNSTVTNAQFNCKASAYFPVCSGSEYQYTDTRGMIAAGTTLGAPNNFTLQNIGDTVIETKTYQKIKGEFNQNAYYNVTNGELTKIVLNTNNQFERQYYKLLILKSDAPVGTNWTDVNAYTGGITESITNKIISKGISRTVANKTYNDVMYIRQTVTASNYNNGTTPYMYVDLYYAKNIGLIESVNYSDANNNNVAFHHKLINAIVQ